MLLVLEVSMLERMFNPQVTSALTRTGKLLVGCATGTTTGGVCGVFVVEDEAG